MDPYPDRETEGTEPQTQADESRPDPRKSKACSSI